MIFVDTGPFIARYVKRDQYHKAAKEYWERLVEERRLYTSNFVLDEVFTYLGRVAGAAFAVERGKYIYASSRLNILRPKAEHEISALGWMSKFSDQQVSFTDCVSFALMIERGIDRVFTFDRHFVLAGFERWPG